MKILLTADTVGGVWTYALELLDALRTLAPALEVTFATLGGLPDADQQAELGALLPPARTFHSATRLEWMPSPWEDVGRAGEWLLDLARQVHPNVIHLNHGFAHGDLPWPAPVLLVGHSCVRTWWRAVKGEPAPPEWDIYSERVAAGLRAANLFVTPSRAMLAAFREEYDSLPQAEVWLNGRGPREEFREVPPERKEALVFAAGRVWDEAKNLAALARVTANLPWRVEIAGKPEAPDGRSALSSGGKLHLLGRVPSEVVAERMRAAAIFAAPARYEPFGLAILEAALCGCALVLGDIPSLRELWDGAAVFVDPASDSALAAALSALIANPTRRRELSEAAVSLARERTGARMAAGYLSFYKALTTSP